MSTHRAQREDHASGTARWAGDERLAVILRAATAPAHPDELFGEEAAVVAFRAAAAVETTPSRSAKIRTVATKVLTVKAVIAAAVVGSAGVVLAATGGVLPAPWSTVPPTPQTPTSVSSPTTPSAPEDQSAEHGAPAPSADCCGPQTTAPKPGKPPKPEKNTHSGTPDKTTKRAEKPGANAPGRPPSTKDEPQKANSGKNKPAKAAPENIPHNTSGRAR
jgi:hypothetical protein